MEEEEDEDTEEARSCVCRGRWRLASGGRRARLRRRPSDLARNSGAPVIWREISKFFGAKVQKTITNKENRSTKRWKTTTNRTMKTTGNDKSRQQIGRRRKPGYDEEEDHRKWVEERTSQWTAKDDFGRVDC